MWSEVNVYDWGIEIETETHTHVWSQCLSIVFGSETRPRLSGALVPGPLFYPGLTLG